MTSVRRTTAEIDESLNFVSRMQKGGASLSVWGCVTCIEAGPLVFHERRVNGPTYLPIVGDVLPRFIGAVFNKESDTRLYMQDNAPPRKSNCEMKWFERNNIQVLA